MLGQVKREYPFADPQDLLFRECAANENLIRIKITRDKARIAVDRLAEEGNL
jgi:hypothetical protein